MRQRSVVSTERLVYLYRSGLARAAKAGLGAHAQECAGRDVLQLQLVNSSRPCAHGDGCEEARDEEPTSGRAAGEKFTFEGPGGAMRTRSARIRALDSREIGMRMRPIFYRHGRHYACFLVSQGHVDWTYSARHSAALHPSFEDLHAAGICPRENGWACICEVARALQAYVDYLQQEAETGKGFSVLGDAQCLECRDRTLWTWSDQWKFSGLL